MGGTQQYFLLSLLLIITPVKVYGLKGLVHEFQIQANLNACIGYGGKCQSESLQCMGSYIPAYCGSGSGLKCCSPSIVVQDTSDCPGLPIMSRDTWGAATPEQIDNLTLPVRMFFIHHTDTKGCNSTGSCSQLMRSIQMFHMKERGWFDIAYSFLVGDDGRVYEGRGWDREGAHTYHYDKVSLALSFMGNFNSTMPTPEAITAAHKLLQCGQQKKVITQSYSLYGHRDVRDTECPGYTLYNAIRKWDHYNITTDKDGPCLQKGGLCGPTYLPCKGKYITGLCNGNNQRQCCIPTNGESLQTFNRPLDIDPATRTPGRTIPGISKVVGGNDCYGNFMLLRPSGRKQGGVPESRRDVDSHYSLANTYHNCFVQVGNAVCLHHAVIAGVASRESNFGFSLTPDGWGDHHNAYGMMQCDVRQCPVCQYGLRCTTYRFDSCDHILMMSKYVLIPYIRAIVAKFPNWLPEQHIQGGVAAYNFGVGNVQSWANLDVGTTGGDYSNDVIARAQWLVTGHGW
ncbi:uncharacterized protein LOC111108365 [Crassostrea virginica]